MGTSAPASVPARRRLGPAALPTALVLAAGCAARQYPLPMTAAQLAREDGPALAAYLGQPDAGAGVCDLGAGGPHAVVIDPAARRGLGEAFRAGRIPPDRWLACLDRLLGTADPPTARALLTDAVRAARDLASGRDLDADAGAAARFAAIARLYAERPTEVAAEPLESASLLKRLETDLPRGLLGKAGQAPGAELLAALRLERAAWDGAPVDEAWLDRLAAAGDAATLRLAAARLPGVALREAARRRVIRLGQAGSPFPEASAPEVEEVVARLGRNPVALADHPPLRGWLDTGRLPSRTVLVEQRLAEHAARLLAPAPAAGPATAPGPAAVPTVLPEVALPGALRVELTGLSAPVTLCADPRRLDPTPCLAAADVTTTSPLARVGADGSLRLADTLAMDDVLPLAREAALTLPLAVGGLPVAALSWPLRFLPPPGLVLEGAGHGAPGPDLEVLVESVEPDRLVYTVSAPAARFQAVVERADAAAFRLLSRGGQGAPGSAGPSGATGPSGADGRDASCPGTPGQDGGRGGDGGQGGAGGGGGPGGRGGDVRVVVAAPRDLQDGLVRLLRAAVASEGGAGGEGGGGGRGGPGGSGARGGHGTTCFQPDGPTVWLPSGRDGADGADGEPGPSGWAGTPGTPGRVVIVLEP